MIHFACPKCRKVLQYPDENAGEKIACEGCGQRLKIPAASLGAPASLAPPPGVGPFPSEYVGADPLSPKPGTFPSSFFPFLKLNPRLLVVFAVAVLFGISGLGAGYFVCSWLFSSTDISDDVVYFPDGTQFAWSMRFDNLLASDLYKQLKKELREFEKSDSAENDLGVAFSNIKRVTIAGELTKSQGTVTVFRLKKPVSAPDIKSNRKVPRGRKNVEYDERRVANHTIYEMSYESDIGFPRESKRERDSAGAFCLVEHGSALLVGDSSLLRRILEREKKPDLSSGMKEAMKQADFSNTVAFALNLKAVLRHEKEAEEMKAALKSLPGANALLNEVEMVTGTANVGSDLHCDIVLVCRDAKRADETKKITDAGIVLAKGWFKDEPRGIPRELADLMIEALDGLTVQANGPTVSGALDMKQRTVVRLLKVVEEQGKKKDGPKDRDIFKDLDKDFQKEFEKQMKEQMKDKR